MQTFRKILFIADGSKGESAALAKVMELAQDNRATLCLMDVVEEYPDIRFLHAGLEHLWKQHKVLVKDRKRLLQTTQAELKSQYPAVKTSVVVREGRPVVEIVRQVLAKHVDLVVRVSTGHPRLHGMRLGSLDMMLLRKYPCLVLIMKPASKIQHARILTAVDLTLLPRDPGNLDRHILDLATAQTRLEDATLHVLHAWSLPYEKLLEGEARIQFYKSVPQMRRELRKVEKTHLDELSRLYGECQPRVHMRNGAAEKVIPAFAREHKIDLIVMGTLARSGVEGVLIGNTAEKILSKLDCSVLALKPEGFVSPITLNQD